MTIERILSKAQRRGILALAKERDELMRSANEQIAEINAAIDAQAEALRAAYGLPEGQYRFEGDINQVKLVGVEEADAEAESGGEQTE